MRFSPAFPCAAAVTVFAMLASACGASTSAQSSNDTLPSRTTIERRLSTRLEADPNHDLCVRIASDFASGNHDALRPMFDFASLVERIVAHGGVPEATVAQLRAAPSQPVNFAHTGFPEGSQFRCLGTRTFLGDPYLAIRQWTPTRFDYLLIRLTGHPALPIDDFSVVSSGYLHSEGQAIGFDPQMRAGVDTVAQMFPQSYSNDFAGIISAFRTLPAALQSSPLAYFHFINAVYTTERTNSDLYREATQRLEVVLRGRDYALAYWRRIDAARQGDAAAEARARGRLVELLDDYELLTP